MALPTAYLTSVKNLDGIFNAIRSAQAPEQFSQSFLQDLEFKSSSDRLIINVLKSVGLLDANGRPTPRYYEFLDQSQSGRVLAQGIREAYADLFRVNTQAHRMARQDLKNKMRTLTQGKYKDSVLDKMAMTFEALVKQADFDAAPTGPPNEGMDEEVGESTVAHPSTTSPLPAKNSGVPVAGLVYAINIYLPESRDPAVYDALFRSIREHLVVSG